MTCHIRLARPDDEPFLWEMLYHAANMAEDGANTSEAAKTNSYLRPYAADWGRVGDLGVIAETADGRAIGAAWVRQLDGPEHRYVGIDAAIPELAIAVHPSVIGQGVGTLLLRHLQSEAWALYPAVVLSVRESNPAYRLYTRAGFRVVGETVNRVGGRSFVMVWNSVPPVKALPFDTQQINEICDQYPTPFHLYDERGIRAQVGALREAFAWCTSFREYFAVKATPTPAILRLLREEGCGTDCSSLAELVLAERSGLRGEEILFSANNTPAEEFSKAHELGAVINLDDLSHIAYLREHAGLPKTVSIRYNPGPLRAGNDIIGNPVEAKFGVTREQLVAGYRTLRDLGVKRFGLHTMVVSNELRVEALVETAHMLFALAAELSAELGITFAFINLGGGIGIPYRPEQQPVDLHTLSAGVRRAYEKHILGNGLDPVPVWLECGRLITGPHGFLLTRVRHLKETYKQYVGVDATMADLMRPGMYGAYHHITVVGKEKEPHTHIYDVTGSLCENNDKFAIDRPLPEIAPGDLIVIHDTGAHGRAMGFNYNGKLRCGELLLQEDGSVRQIRRPETLDDYFATVAEL